MSQPDASQQRAQASSRVRGREAANGPCSSQCAERGLAVEAVGTEQVGRKRRRYHPMATSRGISQMEDKAMKGFGL